MEQRRIDLSFPIDVLGVVLLGTYPSLRIGQRPGKRKERKTSFEKVGMEEYAKDRSANYRVDSFREFYCKSSAQGAEWIFLDEPSVGIDALMNERS